MRFAMSGSEILFDFSRVQPYSLCKLEILVTSIRQILNESPWKIAIEPLAPLIFVIVTGLGWEHLGHPAKPSPTWLAEVPQSLLGL